VILAASAINTLYEILLKRIGIEGNPNISIFSEVMKLYCIMNYGIQIRLYIF
jgi:hypothetical protein